MKVDVKSIADGFKQAIKSKVGELKVKHGLEPLLVGFLGNDDAGAKSYAEWTRRSCVADGIEFDLRVVAPFDLERKIKEANEDTRVHGIIIYYPCFGNQPSFFGGKMDDYLRDIVAPEKDVEGLCYTYRFNLYHNIRYIKNLDGSLTDKKCLLPCTPLAIIKALEETGCYDAETKLQGKTVTIFNRSDIVGRPLSAMLANDGAEVYSVDIDSIFLMKNKQMLDTSMTPEQALKISDIVVTGVPSKAFKLDCAPDKIKPGSTFINVSQFKNFDITQLNQTSDVKVVSMIGKVTVTMLERNLVRLIEQFQLPGDRAKLVESGGRLIKVDP